MKGDTGGQVGPSSNARERTKKSKLDTEPTRFDQQQKESGAKKETNAGNNQDKQGKSFKPT